MEWTQQKAEEQRLRNEQEDREFMAIPMKPALYHYHKDKPIVVGDIIDVGKWGCPELAHVVRFTKKFTVYKKLRQGRWSFFIPEVGGYVLAAEEEGRMIPTNYLKVYERQPIYYSCVHRFHHRDVMIKDEARIQPPVEFIIEQPPNA